MYALRSQEMAKLRNELKQMESDWKCQLANVQATRTLNKMEDFSRKCKGVQSEKNSSLIIFAWYNYMQICDCVILSFQSPGDFWSSCGINFITLFLMKFDIWNPIVLMSLMWFGTSCRRPCELRSLPMSRSMRPPKGGCNNGNGKPVCQPPRPKGYDVF